MSGQALQSSGLFGQQLRCKPSQCFKAQGRRTCFQSPVAAQWKKVNTVDDSWKKGYFGSGILTENSASADNNYLKRLESKKLLSSIEKAGLLSKAEKAGLTLSRIEQSKLLSTVERLGLLTIAERLLVTDPGRVTALSIPFFLLSVGLLIGFPHDNGFEQVIQYLLVALTAGVSVTFFAGGFVLAAVQE